MPQRHALVIGISQYRQTYWRNLVNACRDAEKVAQYLEKYGGYEVTRVPSQYIRPGSGEPGFYQVVDRDCEFENLVQEIRDFLINTDSSYELLIYFGGHGFLASRILSGQTVGYLAASNSDDKGQNAIPLDDFNCLLVERLRRSTTKLVVLLDCCYAGSVVEGTIERQSLQMIMTLPSQYPNFGILASCRRTQLAYESDVSGHGLFTEAILTAMNEYYAKAKVLTFAGLVHEVGLALRGTGQEAADSSSQGAAIDIVNNFPVNPRSKNNFINILGRLNYAQQKRKFQVFLDDANPRIGAFWLRGERDSAQKWLLSQLWVQNVPNSTKAIKKTLTMTTRQDTERILEKLARWLEVEATPEALIERILENCKTGETVALVLYQVECLDDETLEELIDTFWNPLVNAAQKTYQNHSLDNPLLLFMVDLGKKGDRPCLLNHSSDYDPEHPEQFVELVTQRFQARDFRWLTDHETELYPFLKNGSLEAIKKDMIDYNQKPNTKPEEVFTELCDHFGLDWYSDIARQFLAG
ncbi:caspase family protein [Geitlerinema sp. P-1104]|uniref:caspase family protein n=1 Tax=Geitlerinema sp. P-1104 TaxID=2546230 RepID=UPI001476DD0B|nr:caspase family protein [Geitlerinema sp. P-1104]NMG60846.1 caspase family protein [Geitlerinema sp. P-1104]